MRLSSLSGTFIGSNIKIADVTAADTNKHTVDISAFVPSNCVAINIKRPRQVGGNTVRFFPNEGAEYIDMVSNHETFVLAIINQRIQFQLFVKSEDFDIYMFGYWVQ